MPTLTTNAESPAGRPPPVHRDRPAVQAVDITKRFGSTTALDGVHLRVAEGEAHALVGRNGAGKSTLVSIITGLTAADGGTVAFGGEAAPELHDRDGWRRAVACVYQKSTIIPTLTVAENLFLNRQPTSGVVIQWKTMRSEAQQLIDRWDIGVDVRRNADVLSVEQRQMVEIARALSFGARFIILDEPTAQLDPRGVSRLFERLRALQSQGVSLLYISHHLEEIYQLCQTVTVFRDARHIVTAPVGDLSTDDLVAAMTGESGLLEAADQASTARSGDPVLSVEHLSGAAFHDISLTVGPGEVVGITGSGSSGRIALAETIVGLRRPSAGTVGVAGKVLKTGSVAGALAAGVGFVPRDRHDQGLVEGMTIADNVTMTIPSRLGRFGYLSPRRRDDFGRRMIADLSVVATGPDPAGRQPVRW